MKTINALLSAALCSVMFAAPVHAGTTNISARIAYSDLDLTTAEGARALENRLERAVRTLCGSYDRTDEAGARPMRACIRAAGVKPRVEAIVAAARAKQPPQGNRVASR